ncbi:MAG: glycosyltransferase family 39 protein [Gammaproteobacteria bacterium]|nr:glycosyltransferase family 39 protein [Gammaproteobacteria bacterium]
MTLPPSLRHLASPCALFVAFLLINALFLLDGPKLAGDSDRYLRGSLFLLEHGYLEGKWAEYAGYTGLVAALRLTGLSGTALHWGVVLSQFSILALAFWAYHDLARRLFDQSVAFWALLLFTANIYALRWTPYILTDTVFISTVVLATWAVTRTLHSWRYLPLALVLIAFTAIARPNGIVFAPVFGFFLLFALHGRYRYLAVAGAIVLGMAFSPALLHRTESTASSNHVLDGLEQGWVIWHQPVNEMPRLTARGDNPLVDIARYAMTYPADTVRLLGLRLKTAYWYPRENYSEPHNTVLRIVQSAVGLAFLLGIWGLFQFGRWTPAHLLLLVLPAVQTGIILLTFVDQSHRFVSYTVSLLLLFAASGIATLARRPVFRHRRH